MNETTQISNWNLDLKNYVKEFTFDAGLPSVMLLLCCLLLWLCIFRKLMKILLTFASIFIILICFKKNPDYLSNFLLSAESKKLQNQNFLNQKIELIPDPIPNCANHANAIVILGAGIYQKDLPSIVSQTRLLGLTELLKESNYKNHWESSKTPIIITGGFTNKYIPQSEAQAMKEFIHYTYGNSANHYKIITENESKNTYQNSAYSKEIFEKNNYNKNIILITSSTHMFRAKRTFEKQGFQVCPIPVTSFESNGSGIFNFANAVTTVSLLNEYIGIAGYGLKGWLKL
ncbi:YdcF family protein [Silvanigrella sp.]|jgi:uncharacterized SAM-binding protein YcdF (DUF218 family)|uniref:YdcF family protein n=1 Tax=Silvanigrella sp. TaxID=2024976 RepID=UPI0037C98D8F